MRGTFGLVPFKVILGTFVVLVFNWKRVGHSAKQIEVLYLSLSSSMSLGPWTSCFGV